MKEWNDENKEKLITYCVMAWYAMTQHIDEKIMTEFTKNVGMGQYTTYRLFSWMAENYPQQLYDAYLSYLHDVECGEL